MIAIIGFSARSAGATNADEFWQVIRSAVPQFGPAPFDRWRPESVLSAEPRAAWSGYTNSMAALEDPFGWDRAGFGIPVARARAMDPQQRMALTLAQETFERAHYTDDAIGGRGIGTLLGVASNDYRLLSVAPIMARMLVDGSLGVEDPPLREALGRAADRQLQRVGGYSMAGVLDNIVPAVVQHHFDLHGPAFTVDSACSSGLTAIHLACTLIEAGEIDECLAGGVYVALTPDALIGFAQVGALSPTGTNASFSADADGFTLGEGGALVLLKRLDRALADRDPIHAVIEGWGSSSDGRAPGIMTPNSTGQVRAISAARRRSEGHLPLDYVEGHGTGTVVGDAQEIRSLAETDPEPESSPIPLGSAKSVVGHTLAASGAISVVKAVQMLRHQASPAQPPTTGINPELGRTRFTLAGHRHPDRPVHRIGINSFGFGGSNSHLVLAAPERTLS